MSGGNWAALQEISSLVDSRVESHFDKCLERYFREVEFPFDVDQTAIDLAAAARLFPRPEAIVYVVAWIRTSDVRHNAVAVLLTWLERLGGRRSIVPDTIASERPETLIGLPFIEIIAEVEVDTDQGRGMLTEIAEVCDLSAPDIYFVIPSTAILRLLGERVQMVHAREA